MFVTQLHITDTPELSDIPELSLIFQCIDLEVRLYGLKCWLCHLQVTWSQVGLILCAPVLSSVKWH